ncbi:MAG: VOC family protein [Planctomycetota bacterium]
MTKPIPDGYHTITPYLLVDDATGLVDFLQRGFDAHLVEAIRDPEGNIQHAELKVGTSMVMLGQARAEAPAMPACLYMYVEKCDARYRQAVEAGATPLQEPEDAFYGDRCGAVTDAFGNQWWIATHQETLTSEEIAKRAAEQGGASA